MKLESIVKKDVTSMKIKNSMEKLSFVAWLTVALSAVSVPATLFAEEQKADATIVTQTTETKSAKIEPLATSKKRHQSTK